MTDTRDLAATVRAALEWMGAKVQLKDDPVLFNAVMEGFASLAALEQQAANAQAKYDRDMDEAVEAIRRHYLARVRAEKELRQFGRHQPPCPKWITSGEREDGKPQECYCGFDEALAAAGADTP